MTTFDYDILIIGSGFGGSVCALRAAEAGLRVGVIERGPRLNEQDYEDIASARRPLFRRGRNAGLLDVRISRGLGALTASAVGGGSHVYTAVTMPAPPETFTDAWIGLSRAILDPYYLRVATMLDPTPIPVAHARTLTLQSAASRLGAAMICLPLAMNWPDDSDALAHPPAFSGIRREAVTWLRGGANCRKRTLDTTYLAKAERLGADVLPMREATLIAPTRDDGYCVSTIAMPDDRIRNGAATVGDVTARRVILAAGTLNTVRLLLHCRNVARTLPHVSNQIGERFFTNGDFGALIAGMREPPALDGGPPVTAWIDLWRDDRMFLMETGLWPIGMGLSTLHSGWGRAWSIAVMGYDESPGRLTLSRHGRIAMSRDAAMSEAFDRRRLTRLRELADALGGRLMAPPAWMDRRMPFTVHPMGGAGLADSPDRGVTHPHGEVFGHPGLYVVDASLFPTPTGVAPSMTIAAVAEYLIESALRTW